MRLKDNEPLYNYLKNNYYQLRNLGGLFAWQSFGSKQLDKIEELDLKNFKDIRGIEQLGKLKKICLKDPSDLKLLYNCANLQKIEIELSEDSRIDYDSLIELSNQKKVYIYGRGVKNIAPSQVKDFGDNTLISYYEEERLNKVQFGQVQERLAEITSLITPEMKDYDKAKIIYENLLKEEFIYDNNFKKDIGNQDLNKTMYGPLILNKGNCVGISLALDTALKNVGLQASICKGWLAKEPKEGYLHQWNQVMIEGNWYNMDLTCDYNKIIKQFFLKSDNDEYWAKYHCVKKDDKLDKHFPCNSNLFDHVIIDDLKNNQEIMMLKRQKNEELAKDRELDSLRLENYRQSVLAWYDENPDIRFESNFAFYKQFDGDCYCRHQLCIKNDEGICFPVLEGDFLYDDQFQIVMDIMVRDFTERNKPEDEDIEVKEEKNMAEQEAKATVRVTPESENSLQIEGLDSSVAWQYKEQIPMIAKEEKFQRSLTKKGNNTGTINGILIVLGVLILGIILAILVF